MNDLSLVSVIALLASKLEDSEKQIAELQDDMKHDGALMRTMCDKLAHMRADLSRMNGYELEAERLRIQVEKLERDNARLSYDLLHPTPKQNDLPENLDEYANAYMKAEGKTLWSKGERIHCLQGIRLATGWNLKQCLTYARDYMDSPPETKRSEPGKEQSAVYSEPYVSIQATH